MVCVCVCVRESVDVDDCDGAIGQEFGGGGGAGGHVGSGEEWWGCRKLRWVGLRDTFSRAGNTLSLRGGRGEGGDGRRPTSTGEWSSWGSAKRGGRRVVGGEWWGYG